MRITQTKGAQLLAEPSRRRLENHAYPSLEHARQDIQGMFPNHLALKESGRILVVVKDRSFQVAVFQEVGDPWREQNLV